MRKTTPGIDRIAMQQLRATVRAHKEDLRIHLIHCAQCLVAEEDPYVHCREWWRIKTRLYNDSSRLAALESVSNPQQEGLFSE